MMKEVSKPVRLRPRNLYLRRDLAYARIPALGYSKPILCERAARLAGIMSFADGQLAVVVKQGDGWRVDLVKRVSWKHARELVETPRWSATQHAWVGERSDRYGLYRFYFSNIRALFNFARYLEKKHGECARRSDEIDLKAVRKLNSDIVRCR